MCIDVKEHPLIGSNRAKLFKPACDSQYLSFDENKFECVSDGYAAVQTDSIRRDDYCRVFIYRFRPKRNWMMHIHG